MYIYIYEVFFEKEFENKQKTYRDSMFCTPKE